MQDINNMVKDILRANEENKLAIFIGAGISTNSGYKLWWQIVDRFNENKKYVDNGDKDYSDEEILKIPQFVFNEDEELYFRILEEEYNKLPDDTNPIIDMLLELQPNHIITTNYDRLIEQSIEKQHIYGNTIYEDFSKYSRIINETGFISAKKPHYFIKMHGDLEDRTSIVLKEDDYLEFSNTHALVETFVKSLFVNHTILFAGYGLKDNNLKLIMSWVNNFTKKINEKDKNKTSKYYYINVEDTELSKYDKEYYINKNIHVIEASRIPDVKAYLEKEIKFANHRGQNLYRVAKYLNYGIETSLDDIFCNLAIFENINAITPHELYYAMGLYTSLSNVLDGIEYSWSKNKSIYRDILTELQGNPSSNKSQVIKKSFLKSGIRGIVVSEKDNEVTKKPSDGRIGLLEIFWMQPETKHEILWLGDIDNDFYNKIISHDFIYILHIVSNKNKNVDQLLKQAYLYTYLWEDDKAKDIYKIIDEKLKNEILSFKYLVALFNLSVIDYDERYHIIHTNMSVKHKRQFYTLVQFYDDFPELMKKTIELDTKTRKMITINAITQSGDLKFSKYKQLREEIYLTLRYFINNYIFVMGLGGSRFIRKWFDIVEIYLDITLRIISPNSNMQVSNDYQYERIELLNEDIYFLTYYLDTTTLRFYFKEHNITTLKFEEKQQDYLIKLLSNVSRFDVLPEQSKHSKLAKLINSIILTVGYTKFHKNKLNLIFNQLEVLMINILKSNRSLDYTWFYEYFSYWIECIYSLVRNSDDKSQIQGSVKRLVESILIHFYSSNTNNEDNMGFQITVFKEQGLLINMSNLLEYYFKEKIDDKILTNFLDFTALYQHSEFNILSIFIIELFPALSDEMKDKYKNYVCNRLPNLEIRYVRRALENEIVIYDSVVEQIIISSCHARIKHGLTHEDKTRFNDPLYVVPRLYDRGVIRDLIPYKTFKGYDDFFDFVCFPEEFDYNKFNTDWSIWLFKDKYSTIVLDKAFDILKTKYENKMQNAPTENDKHIYYKYFF